ncbi:hypothetical protein BDA96_02G054100 [Sorghum bicolor]|uniref:Uncharacterized protein n=1 Tax=Sorghum bicolor TaxID=4558 RepID=A0A921RMT3_SORBI|nr:hypothetical protein BDA96_02G054100 [Sorghum bicolor]
MSVWAWAARATGGSEREKEWARGSRDRVGTDKKPRPLPVVARVSQDSSTGLYLISVLDLAGPLLWWPCSGRPGSPEPSCHYTAYPYNPVNGKCGSGVLTWEWLSANTTDGQRPLYPVSFRSVASCAPDDLPFSSFPELFQWQVQGRQPPSSRYPYPGVAGLSRSPLSLPSQVAAGLKVSNKFALCLPHVAIFGGRPVHIPGSADDVETVTDHLGRTRLLRNPKNSAYYIDIAGIAVNGARVALPDGALTLDATGQGGVALSTVTPYTVRAAPGHLPRGAHGVRRGHGRPPARFPGTQ